MLWVETIKVEELDFSDKELFESSSNVVEAVDEFFNRGFVLSWMEIEYHTIFISIQYNLIKSRGFNFLQIHNITINLRSLLLFIGIIIFFTNFIWKINGVPYIK